LLRCPHRGSAGENLTILGMRIITIVCRDEIARARVLATSVAAHTGSRLAALVLDASAEDLGSPEPFAMRTPEQVGIAEIGTLASFLTRSELRDACKPLLLMHERALAGGESMLFLDADSLVCGPLDDLDRLAGEHDMLVRRHTARPIPNDGKRPHEADLRAWGLHDGGLFALGAGGDHGPLLDWWAARARDGDAEAGSSLIDRVATFGAGAYELADDGVGASFWDLYEREIVAHEQTVLIDGSPLRLMRFPGFDVHHPHVLTNAQSRLRVHEIPALAALCERYAGLLREAGEEEASQVPYAFDRLPDGTRLDHRLRTICRRAIDEGGLRRSPFTRWGMEELYAWLSAPAVTGAAFGLNRLCMIVCDLHPEVREAYPNLDHDHHAFGLVEWMHEHGVREGTLPAAVVPPRSLEGLEVERRRLSLAVNFGVNVAGYFNSELGIGEAARLLVDALDAVSVPLLPVVPPTLPPARDHHPYTVVPATAAAYPVNVIAINADGLRGFHDDVGMAYFENRHNIGVWWWEVDAFPQEWHEAFELVDEVWVGTEHIARALTPVSPVPIHTVRFPIVAPHVQPLPRAALGLDDEWIFLSMFDHGSVLERKNPIGTIAAFAAAFAPDSGAVLVLKSVNAENDPDGRGRVRAAAAPYPHVRLLEGYASPAETHALIATADCFVSLHRAEGLGLSGAEAMAAGKPVIATAYSGNLDYMTAANSYLVDYTLCEVGPGCWPYPEDAHWAAVDLDAAARAMREVFDDQTAARERGARAAADIAATHSPAAAGRTMRSRLEHIFSRREIEAFLPIPEFPVTLTRGRGGRLLRRLAPGVLGRLEQELSLLWAADEQRAFDLHAATRGTLLSTQAATLAALRRVEARAPDETVESDRSPRAARFERPAR
jgi:glycosyltransferase involved in cell wall biosynthesis